VFSTRLEHKIIICKLTPGPDSDSVLDVQGQYIDTSAYPVNISLTSDEVRRFVGWVPRFTYSRVEFANVSEIPMYWDNSVFT